MLNVIDEIIEIDKNARKSIAEANARAEEIKKNANAQADKIKGEFNERIEKRLSIVNENYSKFADDEINSIAIKKDEAIARLEKTMNEFSGVWRSEILERIIGKGNVSESGSVK